MANPQMCSGERFSECFLGGLRMCPGSAPASAPESAFPHSFPRKSTLWSKLLSERSRGPFWESPNSTPKALAGALLGPTHEALL